VPALQRKKHGRIAGLFASSASGSVKEPASQLTLTFAGVLDDGHAGMTRPAGVREPAFKRGHEIANMRQLSLVSMEELADAASLMGLARIDPGWIAANIAIEGAGPITQFPSGTIIRFQPSQASIYVTGLNTPCTFAAKLIAKAGRHPAADTASFVRHATGRRGLVGIVYAAGVISVGDSVEAIFAQPELPGR
jgi:MOSC domain-containing protein YiiM